MISFSAAIETETIQNVTKRTTTYKKKKNEQGKSSRMKWRKNETQNNNVKVSPLATGILAIFCAPKWDQRCVAHRKHDKKREKEQELK